MPFNATLQSRMPGTTANTAQCGHSLCQPLSLRGLPVQREGSCPSRADVGLPSVAAFSRLTLTFHHLKWQLFFPHTEADPNGQTNLFSELKWGFRKYTKLKETGSVPPA